MSFCFGALIIFWKGERGRSEVGDSGGELGEGSVMEGESNVDSVVVGDELVEFESTDAALSRC